MLKKLTIGFIVLVAIGNINGMSKRCLRSLLVGKNQKISRMLLTSKPSKGIFARALYQNSNDLVRQKLITKLAQSKKSFIVIGIATGAITFYSQYYADLALSSITSSIRYREFDISNINGISTSGEILLTAAVKNDDIETLSLLLAHKDLDIDARNQFGRNALMEAQLKGKKEIVMILIMAGAGKDIDTIEIEMPTIEILQERLENLGLTNFAEKTKIINKLAGKKFEALSIAIEVELAIYNYNKYMQQPKHAILMQIRKPSLLKALLKDVPQALHELEELGIDIDPEEEFI